MTDAPERPSESEQQEPTPAQPLQRCRPFSAVELERRLVIDGAVRWAVAVAVIVLILLDMLAHPVGAASSSLLILLVVASWVLLSIADARVAARLPVITAMLDENPDEAEDMLARALARWPLHRSLRLLLMHRLAVLRHQQQRLDESAAICQWMLSRPLGNARHVRPHLCLLLAEARLTAGDLVTAYWALSELHRLPRTLIETLQMLALQTRYEVAVGHDAAALSRLAQKLPLIELMPAPQCGATHALLAGAADRLNRPDLAQWLRERAELLAGPQPLAA